MSKENKQEMRFYVCLGLTYILLMISLFLPPVNVITASVLYAAIIILGIGALSLGLDISGILREIRLLKTNDLELLLKAKEEDKQNTNEN